MTTGGWIFMVGSVITVWSLVIWCFGRVLQAPRDSAPHDEK